MINKYKWLIIFLFIFTVGCTGPRTAATRPEPRQLGNDLPSFGSADSLGSIPVYAGITSSPTGSITLRKALELALLNNPDLAAASWNVRAAEAETTQAGTLLNPELGITMEEFGRNGNGIDSSETEISLGHVIELGNKRHWRKNIAEAEEELAGWEYENKRLDIFSETSRRYINTLYAAELLKLNLSTVEWAEKSANAVKDRVEAGKEPLFQEAKASAELEMVRMDVYRASNDLNVARKRLAEMWGYKNLSDCELQGSLENTRTDIPSIDIMQSQLTNNPSITMCETRLHLKQAALASEKSARIPDVGTTVGIKRFEEDGSDALAFGIAVPLPLFDRNRGGIASAEYKLAGTIAEIQSMQTSLSVDLAEVHARLSDAHSRVTVLKNSIVPALEKAFDAAHEGYRQGKFGYLDILDAQRTLFEAKHNLLDAMAECHLATIDAERITVTSMDNLMEMTKGDSE